MGGAAPASAVVTASLYQRLGGAAVLAAVVDDALDRHAANPTLAPRFRGLDLPQLKGLALGFLSASAGGPGDGLAPDLEPWHAAMCFSPTQLQAVVGDLNDALREKGVGAIEVGEVLNLYVATGLERLVAVSS